eukprot:CAMPEP_0169169600 /NCGR_PEP_ID=MMETSP1015-20121227/61658_1 /TAXON_ID=342587 /ORGANISM="Karlodinium micrum, Strain CCMP2283" /LENGTH=189 /DNA_ID=CAMNT_0009242521 /DNA_START=1 /DNA_END=570 /DNA_ORIENTATION=-
MTAAFGINAAKILTTNELAMDSAVDYPLKPCCAHKVVPGTISIKQEGAKYFLVVDDRKFSIYDENDSSGFPWGDVGAHSIGIFTERNEEEMHFKDTSQTAKAISADASWTPSCLAPLAILVREIRFMKESLTTLVQAMPFAGRTSKDSSRDQVASDAFASGIEKRAAKSLPSWTGEFAGMDFLVPTSDF